MKISANPCALYFATLLCTLFSSCAVRSVYIPVTQNIPLFDSNKRASANAYLGGNHIELQAAYNPLRHLAVATNINFGDGIAIYDVALGTYAYSKSTAWRYELFAGYGSNDNFSLRSNTFSFLEDKYSYTVTANYNKYYLQPAIGFFSKLEMYKLDYSFSLSARTSLLYFQDFVYKQADNSGSTPVYTIDREYYGKTLFLLEPCITNKVGMKNIYGVLQLQAIIPYSQQIDLHNTKFSPGYLFSVGLQYNLNFKKRHR